MNPVAVFRRLLALGLLLWLSLSPGLHGAAAQGAVRGPITIVLPLAPGDAADITLRAMADDLGRQLQVPVTVVNRPGAGGSIGVQSVVTGPKDGTVLLFTQNGPLTMRRALEPQAVTYDPGRDLVPLALTTRTPSVLVVRKDAPYKSFKDLVDAARKGAGAVRIGTAGAGSAGDVSVLIVNALTGVDITSVPYRGAAPAVTDVLGGQIDGVILAQGAVSAHLRSGALKALATSTHSPELPGVPTLSELGYAQDIQGVWLAFFAPAGVPADLAPALLPALEKAARNPATAARLRPLGILQEWLPGDALAAEVAHEYQSVLAIVKATAQRKR